MGFHVLGEVEASSKEGSWYCSLLSKDYMSNTLMSSISLVELDQLTILLLKFRQKNLLIMNILAGHSYFALNHSNFYIYLMLTDYT